MSAQISVLTFKATTIAVPLAVVSIALSGCSSTPKSPESAVSESAKQSSTAATPAATSANLETTDADTARQTIALALPKNFGRATGDWDQIIKRGAPARPGD